MFFECSSRPWMPRNPSPLLFKIVSGGNRITTSTVQWSSQMVSPQKLVFRPQRETTDASFSFVFLYLTCIVRKRKALLRGSNGQGLGARPASPRTQRDDSRPAFRQCCLRVLCYRISSNNSSRNSSKLALSKCHPCHPIRPDPSDGSS